MWIRIERAPKDGVIDLWGSEKPNGMKRRWPDCWWGPTFPQGGRTLANWYCRLGTKVFRVYPTHYMDTTEIRKGPPR
jgi:hypothetical protein